jgi:hypothetical protein
MVVQQDRAVCLVLLLPVAAVVTMSSSPEFEIVGLNANTNGRSCTLHECCGKEVEPGDVLRLVPTSVSIDGVIEDAVKCVLVIQGNDTCTVGFVPRVIANTEMVKEHHYLFVQVKEVYDDSDNTYKHKKSYKNHGMAKVAVLHRRDGRAE